MHIFRTVSLSLLLLGASVSASEEEASGQNQVTEPEYPTSGYLTVPLRSLRSPGTEIFAVDISVGTPPQPMTAVLDTSGNLTYVPSVQCEDANCRQRHRYNSSLSSTYQADGTPFDIGYGTGVSGVRARETLGVADVSIANQMFGEATHMLADYFKYQSTDGSFSVGYSNSILDDLQAAGEIEQRLMGLYIGADGADGELTLGGLNADRYSGELQFLDILPWKVWGAHVDDIAVENLADVELCGLAGCPAVFSSSSPYFIVSLAKAQLLADVLGAQPLDESKAAFYFDCSRVCELPSITLTMAGQQIELSGRDYSVISNLPGGAQMCISGFVGNAEVPDNVWGFGTLLLEKIFTVYDKENGRIGFAESKH